MDAKDLQRSIITIGGQEVSLERRRPAAGASEMGPGDLKIALEPVPERVVYEVDRVPGRWGAGLVIALFALAGLGLVLGLTLIIRALVIRANR